ncbi:hypothetical protein JAAARDRAFT_187966 [Jaapia argillacea MUCL 33604]|uniref:FAD-binding FR-type domain-containing protein n=1 Tax=Jaapia argillacea MUCL 33604 TaxID=933084 RepID=A0A067QPT8_9AGAM|nr:hypothetical protein JAAARDRAFT_187966 [Jaapia argillacea MUCL 33604]
MSPYRQLAFGVWLSAATWSATYMFWPESESRAAPTRDDIPISPSHFTPATLLSSETTGPNSKLLTLKLPTHLVPFPEDLNPVWSIYMKDSDIQVERPYTPLEGIDKQGIMKFWIKRYVDGEVGKWLHSKNVGDSIEIRGPVPTWAWREGEYDELVMISGGTGITPMYQLIHHLLINQKSTPSTSTPRITLLHSSRTPVELPPPEILQPLKSLAAAQPERFKFHLFVDSPGNLSSPASHNLQVSRIGTSAVQKALGLSQGSSWFKRKSSAEATKIDREKLGKRVLFLVSGPDRTVAAIAGPMGRNLSQGDVGGILGEMGFTSQDVWKL